MSIASLREIALSKALGHYQISVVTGTLAAALAAAAQVFQFKWTDANNMAIITRLKTRFVPLTPFTAATSTDHTSFDAIIARSYAGGGAGGGALTLTGNNAKLKVSHGTSLVSEIRVATTAALTAATTLDSNPFAQSIRRGNRINPAAATEEVIQNAEQGVNYQPDLSAGEHPLVLAASEGFVIANRTVWPAAGTGILQIELGWLEVPNFT